MKPRMFYGAAWRARDGMRYSGLWFRVCGYGLHISARKRADAFFSERAGMRRALYVFGIRFECLTP